MIYNINNILEEKMSSTILPKDFDINKVTYEPFTSIKGTTHGKNDKKQIFIKYAGNLLRFQTPFAIAPFGVAKSYEGEDWVLDIDLDRLDIESIEGSSDFKQDVMITKLRDFKNMLSQLDKKNIEHIVSQYSVIFPGKTVKDVQGVSEDNYNHTIKRPTKEENKGKYSDVFRSKLQQPYFNEKTGKKSFTVYGRDKKEIEWYNKDGCTIAYQAPWTHKKMLVQAIVCCTGMWLVNGKLSCGFKVEQIQVRKPIETGGFAFKNNDEELVENVPEVVQEVVPVVQEVVPVVVPTVAPVEVEHLIEDDDEEYEDEQ